MSASEPLVIAFDVTARIAGSTGVARYAVELERALVESGVEVRRYAIGRAATEVPAHTRRFPVPLRIVHRAWSTVGLPRIEWLAPAAHVVHTLDMVAPPTRMPSVITMHDLDAIEHPELHSARAIETQRAQLDSLHRVSVILSNSKTTAGALLRHGIAEEKVVVAPLGFSHLPPAEPATIEGAERYVLCVGRLDARKGQDVLLKAWNLRRHRHRGNATALVLVGPDGYGAQAIRVLAAGLVADGLVRFEGRVDDERLAALYRGAAVVCVPSRAEGFGLPVLEALALGVPVVASDLDATHEVAGDTALLVPAGDDRALADALESVLDGGAGVMERTVAGTARAQHFSWSACAEATVRAYQQAAGWVAPGASRAF